MKSSDNDDKAIGNKDDVLFAISDMIKEERSRLTEDVVRSLDKKFSELDKRMSESNLRPLKLKVKMETNDVRKSLYDEHLNLLQTEFKNTINMGNTLKNEICEVR